MRSRTTARLDRIGKQRAAISRRTEPRKSGIARLVDLGLKESLLAAFLLAGYFKADDRLEWVPIDLTVGLMIIVVALAFFEGYWAKPDRAVGRMLLLFAAFVPALMLAEWSEYATDKAQRFFTITLVSALAPLFLIRSRQSLRRFLNAVAVIGIILSVDAVVILVESGELVRRLSGGGSNPIALGRAAGFSLIWMTILWIERREHAGVASGVAAVLTLALVSSGSRGPVLATAVTFLVMVLVFGRRVSKMRSRSMAAMFAVGVALMMTLPVAPEFSVDRVQSITNALDNQSNLRRQELLETSLPAIPTSPLGRGVGGFASNRDLGGSIGGAQHPHNIIVETAIEGGWLAAIWLVYLLLYALRRTARIGRAFPEAYEIRLLFGGIAFMTAASMVSGSLNDNRLLFALVALGLHTQIMHDEHRRPLVPVSG